MLHFAAAAEMLPQPKESIQADVSIECSPDTQHSDQIMNS